MPDATVIALPVAGSNPGPDGPEATLPALTGRQKAAVLVLQLGRAQSAAILGQLSESELEDLSVEIARMGTITPEVSAAVISEFADMLASGDSGEAHGGMDAARDLLHASLGTDRASVIVDRVSQNFVDLPFAFLQQLDHRQIVSFLSDEHPQTIALVLAHLPAALASLVLAGLGRELQADVAHRIAVMDRTSPDLIRQVENGLERRLSSLGVASNLSTVGGLRPLIEIINRADRGTERLILEGLEELDPTLADQVRSQMFMFEDLITLEDRAIQLVLREVQAADLAVALKGVAENVRARIMQNMSERAALNLADELELLGPVRVANVEEAQAGIVRIIRALEESGQIVVGRGTKMLSSPELAAVATPVDSTVETWLPRELRDALSVVATTRSDDNVVHAAPLFELAGRASIPTGVLQSERSAARAVGYAAGWDSGMRAARLAAETESTRKRGEADRAAQQLNVLRAQAVRAVHAAASQLEQRAAVSVDDIEDLIVSSAFAIAEALVAATLRDDSARGTSAVRRALSLAPSGEAVTIALSPVDHAALTADGTASLRDPDRSIQLVADPRLAPGDASAMCGATTIDARLSTGLERVRAVLAR